MNEASLAEVRDVLRPYSTPPWWLIYKAFFHIACLVVCVALAIYVSVPFKPIFMVPAAAQFIGLYALLHGASHYHLTRNRKLNDALGMFLATVLGTSFHAYRTCHLRHHVRLRQDDDPQEVVHTFPKSRAVTAAAIVLASVIGAALFIWVRVPFLGAKYGTTRRVLAEMLLPIAFHGTLIWAAFTYLPMHAIWTIAATLLTAIVWGSLLDIVYHQGLPVTGDETCSRSLDCDLFGFWVLNGEHRHAEHHAFPNLPQPNWLQAAHAIRPTMEREGTVYERGYLLALWKCWVKCPVFLPPAPSVAEK